mmetsp:Transcript_342/g.339  ORF Transcript_342/g.339 Transcript_342/m.339 type:complete len:97 (+) Transcript_342:199-489(+)
MAGWDAFLLAFLRLLLVGAGGISAVVAFFSLESPIDFCIVPFVLEDGGGDDDNAVAAAVGDEFGLPLSPLESLDLVVPLEIVDCVVPATTCFRGPM